MSIFPALHGPSAGMIYAVALSVEVTFYAIVTFLMATAPVRRDYGLARTWIDRVAGGLIGVLGLSLIIRR